MIFILATFLRVLTKKKIPNVLSLCLESRGSMTMLKDFFIVFLLCRHPPSARREEPSRVVVYYVVVCSVLVLFIDFLFDLTGYIVRT